ncbi:MAG: hypothetical protein ABI635_04105 [Actinomycetota bacterium]
MKKAKELPLQGEPSLQETAVCPTCGQPLEGATLDEVVRVPDLAETAKPAPAESPAPRPDAPTDADVEWALSPPLTAEKREFLRAATQTVTVEQDRFESKEAQLAAFEAMWPPRNPEGRRGAT